MQNKLPEINKVINFSDLFIYNKDDVPFLSKRYQYPRRSIVKLDIQKKKIIKEIIEELQKGNLCFKVIPCPCGKNNDLLLSTVDRFGLFMRTVICKHCGLIRVDPQLDDESLKKFYQNYYRILYSFNKTPTIIFQDEYHRGELIYSFIRKNTKFRQGLVFEVGTGYGGILFYFKMKGSEVIGVDYNEDSLRIGRKYNIELYQGGIDYLINLKRKADLIIYSHTFEHLTNINLELIKIKEILNDDGLLYIEVPGLEEISVPLANYDILYHFQTCHNYYFNLDTLNVTLKRGGFELIKGNENVQGIFKKQANNIHSIKNEQEFLNKTLNYLRKFDSVRGNIIRFYKSIIFKIYCYSETFFNKYKLFLERFLKKKEPFN